MPIILTALLMFFVPKILWGVDDRFICEKLEADAGKSPSGDYPYDIEAALANAKALLQANGITRARLKYIQSGLNSDGVRIKLSKADAKTNDLPKVFFLRLPGGKLQDPQNVYLLNEHLVNHKKILRLTQDPQFPKNVRIPKLIRSMSKSGQERGPIGGVCMEFIPYPLYQVFEIEHPEFVKKIDAIIDAYDLFLREHLILDPELSYTSRPYNSIIDFNDGDPIVYFFDFDQIFEVAGFDEDGTIITNPQKP